MNPSTHREIIGLDVLHEWLDIHCLADGCQLRLPNTADGHSQRAEIVGDRNAPVCFKAAGGQEWRLWANSETPSSPRFRNAPPERSILKNRTPARIPGPTVGRSCTVCRNARVGSA